MSDDSPPFATPDGSPAMPPAHAGGPGNYVSDPRGGQGIGSGPGFPYQDRPQPAGSPSPNPQSIPGGGVYPDASPKSMPGGTGTPGNGQKPFRVGG